LYESENKHRLFPYTALAVIGFITQTDRFKCAVRTEAMNIIWVILTFRELRQASSFTPLPISLLTSILPLDLSQLQLKTIYLNELHINK